MIIQKVRIKNFRCIRDATLDCESLTVLVGQNGSGKSSFLKAIEMFYDPAAKYSEEDFYNRDTSEPILIEVTFSELTEVEKSLFATHLDGNGLTVQKELAWPLARGSQKYFGSILRNPNFQSIRTVSRVTEKREKYRELRTIQYPDLPDLPGSASTEQIEQVLKDWEQQHPDKLQRMRDDGQFFGFKEVGTAKLERYTRFLLIPAVRDASEDATEGKGRVISQLLDWVVRSTLSQREDIRQLREDVQKRYQEIVDPSRLEELQTLESKMNSTIAELAPGTLIQLLWQTDEAPEIPLPKAEVKIVEHGYATAVERAGHGSQRALIMTMLQHLAAAEMTPNEQAGENESVLPSLIIAIEEPELYQHPNRQRHLSQILLRLVEKGVPGVAEKVQIIYTTHSPLFVDLKRFHHIRLVRRENPSGGEPKHVRVFQTTLEKVTREVERAEGVSEGSYVSEGLLARLHTLMTPWTNEGFFASVIVLVEGEDDRTAILGAAKAIGHELESMDIAVIPCMGKTNLHKTGAIFSSLEVPVYIIWDSDEGKKDGKPEDNHRLLRFFNYPVEDYPEKIEERFACFKIDLDSKIRDELGSDIYDKLLEHYKSEFGYDRKEQATKNPVVIQRILEDAFQQGKDCPTLRAIVQRIVELKKSI